MNQKMFTLFNLLGLMIASLGMQAAVTRQPQPGIFYDFEEAEDEGSHIENWRDGIHNFYHVKKTANLGAVLISEGIWALPLGYGKHVIIKNGKMAIEKNCPNCKSRYSSLEGVAFSNCFYKVKGKKDNGYIVASPWIRVDDFMHVYKNPKKAAKYMDLVFECLQLSDAPPKDDDF